MSLSFHRNPLISLWFAQGRQKGKRKGDSQEQRFWAGGLLEPGGTLALWQKVVEWNEPATIRFQFTIQGSTPLLENLGGAFKHKNSLGELTLGVLPSPDFSAFCGAKCFSMAGTNVIVCCLGKAC